MEKPTFHNETRRDYAFRVLKEMIVNLEIEPGSKVDINELSEKLGLSRTPVREALIDLAKSGIVEIHPQSASIIALVDYSIVDESVFMRVALESAVIRKICEMDSLPDFFAIDENLIMQKNSIAQHNLTSFRELDDDFHAMLFKMAGCLWTYQLYNGMMIHFDRLRQMNVRTLDNTRNIQEHCQIVESLKQRDAKQACDCLSRHLQHYKSEKEIICAKYAEFIKA